MAISLLHSRHARACSAFQSPQINGKHHHYHHHPFLKTPLLPSLIGLQAKPIPGSAAIRVSLVAHCSFLQNPALWLGRICAFYVLLKTGIAGSISNPFISSELGGSGGDLGFSKWIDGLRGASDDKEAINRRKLVSKWHPTTKGTLKRSYRVPTNADGRHLLKSIAALLADDDHFVDVTTHKGCQIRRESAHGESVCCKNVRALFDELPTPHLSIEITAFPAGPLTDKDYIKAEKLEKVLRSGASI